MLQPIDQLANIADNATPEFERALRSLIRAVVTGDNDAHQRARESITRAIGQTHALAELLGRRRAIIAAGLGDMPDGSIQFSAVVPAIEFEEAIANIIDRTPVLAVSGEAVKEAFRRDPNVIAFARAADLAATRRVQRLLATFGAAGTPLPKAERVLQELEGWTKAYSCFLPGTRVDGDVVGASKAPYSGPALEIKTDDGRRLAVTVNHPVLTASGWRRADDVSKGDHLVCYGEPLESFDALRDGSRSVDSVSKWRAIDDEDVPAFVEDVFEAIAVERPPWSHRQGPVSALDFHGDARFFDDEVHRVATDGVLPEGRLAEPGEGSSERLFVHRDHASDDSAGASLRSLAQHLSGLWVAPVLAQRQQRSLVAGRRLAVSPRDAMRLGLAPDGDPALFEALLERPRGHAKLFGELVQAFAGKVSTRRVVNVERIWWTGHVYDLQTSTGFIVSQGIVTSNSTVFRTNLNSAFTEGIFAMARDDDVRATVPALMFVDSRDPDVRPNHRAAHGMIASVGDPVWDTLKPPLGYNCRCAVRLIDKFEVKEKFGASRVPKATIPPGAFPDPGFKT